MMEVVREAMHKGYSPLSSNDIEINKFRKEGVLTIAMTFAEMCQEVDKAILRKWPLYGNHSDSELLRNMVYDKYVAPWILPVVTEDDDEYEE